MTNAVQLLAHALRSANMALLAADGWTSPDAETYHDPDGKSQSGYPSGGISLTDALYIARVRRERRQSEEFDPYLAAINSLEISLVTAAGWVTQFRDGSLLWRDPAGEHLVGIRMAVRIAIEGGCDVGV